MTMFFDWLKQLFSFNRSTPALAAVSSNNSPRAVSAETIEKTAAKPSEKEKLTPPLGLSLNHPDFIPRVLSQLDKKSVNNVTGAAQEMPAFPMVTTRLLKVLSEADCSAEEVVKLVQLDPSVAAGVLRIANSVAMVMDEQITNLDAAVLRIGFDMVQAVALRCSLSGMVQVHRDRTRGYNTKKLWTHSIATSIYAGELARRLPMLDASEAVTAGLLHDFGKLVANTAMPEQVKELLATESTKLGESLLAKEERVLGACHTAFGAMLARHWNLPDPLVMAIELHHHPSISVMEEYPLRVRHLTAVTFVANQFAKLNGYPGGDREIDLPSPELMQSIGLQEDLLVAATEMPAKLKTTIDTLVSM